MFDYNQKLNLKQKVLTKAQFDKLVENHRNSDQDHAPVVKFFALGAGTWLISELDPESGNAFGLCDLGMGSPELGYVSLHELIDAKNHQICGIERDLHFIGDKPMSEYADAANAAGCIQV